MKTEWLQNRITYINGLKNPTEAQQLLSALSKLPERTALQERKIAVLAKAEMAAERLSTAKSAANKMLNDEKRKEAQAIRKARDHEMYQSAGLMSLAGLIDKTTGKTIFDAGTLIGALSSLSKIAKDDPRWASWKQNGDALLAQREKEKKVL